MHCFLQDLIRVDGKMVIAIISALVACTALGITLYDRMPHLIVRSRRGHWCGLKPTQNRQEVVFTGVVEVYNLSSRANAIRSYEFFRKQNDGTLEKMENELYRVSGDDDKEVTHNVTPFAIAPYSGSEVRVMGLIKGQLPSEMIVVVELEDLFGKHHRAEVKARHR
jgi:hypothetical protein